MRKFILVLTILIALPILAIFFINVLFSVFGYKLPKDEKISIRVTKETGKILKKTKNLRMIGWGGSGVGEVKMMAISLTSTDGPFDIKKARELVVYCSEVFLKEINSSKKIRPYLQNYPFTVKNIKVEIFFHDKEDKIVSSPFITCASTREGIISYSIDKSSHFECVHKESYEQALKILNKEK